MHLFVGLLAIIGLQRRLDVAPHGFKLRHTGGQRFRVGVVVVFVVVVVIICLAMIMVVVLVVVRMHGDRLGRGHGGRSRTAAQHADREHADRQHAEENAKRAPVTAHRRTHHASPDSVVWGNSFRSSYRSSWHIGNSPAVWLRVCHQADQRSLHQFERLRDVCQRPLPEGEDVVRGGPPGVDEQPPRE